MDLELHVGSRNFAEALHTYVERRLQFALSAFARQVSLVTVRLADSNDCDTPLRHCEITAELVPSGKVVAREMNTDLYVAVDRAVRRMVHLLRKQSDGTRRPLPNVGGRFRPDSRIRSLPRCRGGGLYAGTD